MASVIAFALSNEQSRESLSADMLCFGVLILAAGVLGQERCCAPSRFEGYEDFVLGYSRPGERPDAILGESRIHFDSVGQRLAYTHITRSENGGETREFRVIDRFSEGQRLFIEGEDCTISPLSGELRPVCVNEEAEYMGNFRIGVGPNAQQLDDWVERSTHTVKNYQATREGCYPFMSREAHVAHDGEVTSYINIVSFNRLTEGIADDRVFETPDECRVVKYTPEMPEALKLLERRFIRQ